MFTFTPFSSVKLKIIIIIIIIIIVIIIVITIMIVIIIISGRILGVSEQFVSRKSYKKNQQYSQRL